jgi:hypothetical protein
MLLGYHLCKKFAIPRWVGWALTMVGAFFAWLCFYETRTSVLLEKMATILNPMSYTWLQLQAAIATLDPTNAFVLAVFLCMACATLLIEWLSLSRLNEPYAILRKPSVLAVMVILTILLAPSEKNDFIYFAF